MNPDQDVQWQLALFVSCVDTAEASLQVRHWHVENLQNRKKHKTTVFALDIAWQGWLGVAGKNEEGKPPGNSVYPEAEHIYCSL